MPTEKQILPRLRTLCLALPETDEVESFGHPTFRAAKKTFAVLETYKGRVSIAFKSTGREAHELLDDARFCVTPYIGKHGWLSLDVGARVDWDEVRALVTQSYRLVALKRMLAQLESAAERAPARGAPKPPAPHTLPQPTRRSAKPPARGAVNKAAGRPPRR